MNAIYTLRNTLVKESPGILTAFAITGVVTTGILTAKAVPKAITLLEEERYRRKYSPEFEFEPLEVIQICWRPFVPAIAAGTLTIMCILGVNSIHAKRNAALAGLYSIATEGLREYQAKVVEQVGKKKEQKIRDEIAQDALNNNPYNEKDLVVVTGEALFYDKLSGRYFKSTVETIRKAQNDFNYELMTDMFKSVNEWYDEIGLPHVDMGEQQGWDLEKGYLDVQFSTMLADNQEPCIVLTYSANPRFC